MRRTTNEQQNGDEPENSIISNHVQIVLVEGGAKVRTIVRTAAEV